MVSISIFPHQRLRRSVAVTAAVVTAGIIGTAITAYADPLQDAVDRFRNRAVPLVVNWVNAGLQVGLSIGGIATTLVVKAPFDGVADIAQLTANAEQLRMATQDWSNAYEYAVDEFRMDVSRGVPPDQASLRMLAAIKFAQDNFTNAKRSMALSTIALAGSRSSSKVGEVLLGVASLQLSIQNFRTATEFMISDGNAAGMELQNTVRALYPPPPPLCSSLFVGPTNCVPPAPTVTCTPPGLPPMYGSGLSMTFGSPTPPWCTIANAGTVSGAYDPLNVNVTLLTPVAAADTSGRFVFEVGSGRAPTLDSSGTATIFTSPGSLESTSLVVDLKEDPQYCNPDQPITNGFAASATATSEADPKYSVEKPEPSPDGVLACAE